MTLTIQSALQHARRQLTKSDSAPRDAEILLAHVLQHTREFLHTWPERCITDDQAEHFNQLVQKRDQGWPVAYLTGHQAFWSLDLLVNPAVLIPRPETELLVETVLQLGKQQQTLTLVDLGTGSGAIALALAHEQPHWHIHAVDASADALVIARENSQRHNIKNVTFHQSNWCAQLPVKFQADIIVSNPPYIREGDPHLLQGDVRFEPQQALTAGADGLSDIRNILTNCVICLKQDGWLVLEHGYDQGQAVQELFQRAGFTQIAQARDLAGHIRITYGCRT